MRRLLALLLLAIATLIAYLNAGQLVPYAADFVSGLPTTLAIAEAADLGLTEFNGIPIDDTTVIAKWTYVGDANLDGAIDILDIGQFLAAGRFDSSLPAVWQDGDFNYDAVVDALDLAEFLAAGLLDQGPFTGAAAGSAGVVASVPEPGFSTLLTPFAAAGLAALGRLTRRQQHR